MQLLLLSLQQQAIEDLVLYSPLLLQLAAAALQQQQPHHQACWLLGIYFVLFLSVFIACLLLIEGRAMPGPSAHSLLLLIVRGSAAFAAMAAIVYYVVLRSAILS